MYLGSSCKEQTTDRTQLRGEVLPAKADAAPGEGVETEAWAAGHMNSRLQRTRSLSLSSRCLDMS